MKAPALDLAVLAFDEGLIDAEAFALVCWRAGRGEGEVAALLAEVGVDRVVLAALAEGAARLDAIGEDESFAETVAPAFETLPGGPSTLPAAQIHRLGLTPTRFEARYPVGELLGRGGMGEVSAAVDRLLDRPVALKVLRRGLRDERATRRFLAEAQITGQLEHPSVVPVHDVGVLADGRPVICMKRVRGRSLRAVLDERGEPDPDARWGLHRLVRVIAQVCMAVDYAHAKGVVHRDLKPDNIMVGDFGEVMVMDWGVARVGVERATPTGPPGAVEPEVAVGGAATGPISMVELSSPPTVTQVGAIVGTPGYMAPEQAMGKPVDGRADVWALGAMLYEVLTGTRPHADGSAWKVLLVTASADVEAPSTRAPTREIPPDLEEICLNALAREPAHRIASARALHRELEAHLAGRREAERRRAAAAALTGEGEESLWYIRTLQDEERTLAAQIEALPALSGHEPIEIKRSRWALEDRRDTIEAEVERAERFVEQKLGRALELDPESGGARRALAGLWWGRYRAARAAADPRAAARHAAMVRRLDDDTHAPRLARAARLTLAIEPAGAEAALYRYVQRDRVLVAEDPRPLGVSPLGVDLPSGRLLVVLRAPGRATVRLPLMAWQGDELHAAFALPTAAALGDDFVFVPPGRYVRGGDPEALLAGPARVVEVEGFSIARFPVTVAQYFEFLEALDPAEAQARAPREGATPMFDPPSRWGAPLADREGDVWQPDWPVCGVSYPDAEAYAAWRGALDGARYRLPTEDEWEKAARGPDGRIYPWGDHFDPTFCSARGSVPGDPLPKAVGRFATDCSPYGVCEMAGGVREWIDGWFEANQRVVRGGAFSLYGFACRAAGRWGASPTRTQASIGFRLVRG